MKKIGIIGGGFSGTMTAVHIIQKTSEPVEIIIFNEKETFNRGIAFLPFSQKLLLNVATNKMSAFGNKPEHFLDWAMDQKQYNSKDRNIIAHSFLPRSIYGQYLTGIWEEAYHLGKNKQITIKVVNQLIEDIQVTKENIVLCLNNEQQLTVDGCIMANGNHVPRNPMISNAEFLNSKNYYRDPWNGKCISNIDPMLPVFISGVKGDQLFRS